MQIPELDASRLAEAALTEANCGFEPARLARFVTTVARVADRAGRLSQRELTRIRADGDWAARAGVQFSELVDAYLSAARLLWQDALPGAVPSSTGADRPTDPVLMGACVFRAVDDALAMLAAGFAEAGRLLVREDEARRREFVDDLLVGAGRTSDLLGQAERYGLSPAASHCVIVLGASDPRTDPLVGATNLEAAVRARFPRHGVLVAARHRRIVVVLQCAVASVHERPVEVERIGRPLRAAANQVAGPDGSPVISVSRLRPGPAGIASGFREADEGFELVVALGWSDRVVHADELAVFRVLLRDRESMVELVESVLAPLRTARGGATPLLDTLHTYLASGAVATKAARRLHLSVRAVTYRLDRIRTLTGYDPGEVDQRFTLQVAAVGARLLRWPSVETTDTSH